MAISKYLTLCLLGSASVACYADTPATLANLTNNSPFYLELQTGSPAACPKVIAPGASATLSPYYCGYDICSANHFNLPGILPGCAEPAPVNKSSSPNGFGDGGYMAYVGISINYSKKISLCRIGASTQAPQPVAFVPFTCDLNTSTGDINFNYQSITQEYSATDPNITGATQGTPVNIANVTQYSKAPYFKGVNVSGLEYDGTFLDALFQHPDIPDVQYFAQQGMNLIRLPVRAEYIVTNKADATNPGPVNSDYTNIHTGNFTINKTYVEAVYDTVKKYLAHGMSVDLDMHNYMRFCDTGSADGQYNEPTNATDPNYHYPNGGSCHIMTPQDLATIWNAFLTAPVTIKTEKGMETGSLEQLALDYAPSDSNAFSGAQLMFGVMNEPYSNNAGEPTTQDIFNAEVSAEKAIRKVAPNNWVILSGNGWDPLHAWMSNQTDDYKVFTQNNLQQHIADLSHVAIEAHQYFDKDDLYSGRSSTCYPYPSYDAFKKDIGSLGGANGSFAQWIKTNKMPVLLTEFGAASNPTCEQDITYMIQYMHDNAYQKGQGGFIGWTAWRANRNMNSSTSPYGFNSLQQADPYVYSGTGSAGGIIQGSAQKGLMPILMGTGS